MQTQDHFWSRTHSEVVSLSVLYVRQKQISKIKFIYNQMCIYSQQTHSKYCFPYCLCSDFRSGLQSNWTVEGTVGSAEGHGCDASVSAWGYDIHSSVVMPPSFCLIFFMVSSTQLLSSTRQCCEWHHCQADGRHVGGVLQQRGDDP